MNSLLPLCLLVILAATHAYLPTKLRSMAVRRSALCMSEPEASGEPDFAAPENGEKMSFNMNRIVRLGRSRDQDGKSNIWSIEPSMQVVEEESDSNPLQKNLVILGAVIGAAIVALPAFSAFSSLFPDPSDF